MKYLHKAGSSKLHLADGDHDTVCKIISSGTLHITPEEIILTDSEEGFSMCSLCIKGIHFNPPFSRKNKENPRNSGDP